MSAETAFSLRAVRRAAALVVALVLAAPAAALQDPFAALEPTVHRHGLLWRIEGSSQAAPSYVFGTMHVDDPEVVNLAPPVDSAFRAATRVCTEVKMDYEALAVQLQALFFDDGRTLREVAGEPLYAETVAVAERHGLPEAMVNISKPMAMAFMLSMPPQQGGEVLDVRLYGRALREGKEVCGLETPQEQIGALDSLPLDQQLLLLQITVTHYAELQAMLDDLLAVYLDRDLAAMVALARSSPWDESGDAGRAFMDRLVVQRNRLMVERMQPHLQEGGSFIAVGALHLPGEGGILRLLEQRGWRVKKEW